MTKAISETSGEEAIVASEHVFRSKDTHEDIDESMEESILELKDALEENEDCLRVWSKSHCLQSHFLVLTGWVQQR